MKNLVITLLLGAGSYSQAAQCNLKKMTVPASQNIEFEIIFHNSFQDFVMVDKGPRTEVYSRNYKVKAMESAKRIEDTLVLPLDFDLTQDDRTTIQSLGFSLDDREGTNPRDHIPSIERIDRKSRTVTVSVDLENKKIENKQLRWTYQIAQSRPVAQKVEPFPTEIVSRGVIRRLNAIDGQFDGSAISLNKLNSPKYLSVAHKESQCLVSSYEFHSGEFHQIKSVNYPVEVVGPNASARVTVDFAMRKNSSDDLQISLLPQLQQVR